MDEAELAAQLSLLLGEELTDRIPDLNRVLLAIEREPSSEPLQRELHRVLHVVKGASRSAGIVAIEAACHEIETLLAAVAPGTPVPATTLDTAIRFADQLEVARVQLVAGQPVTLGASEQAPVVPSPAPTLPEADASVRVAAVDLDLMMEHSGDVVVARQAVSDSLRRLTELQLDLGLRRSLSANQLAGITRNLASVARDFANAHRALDAASNMLDQHVRRIRLRSISDACQGCERIVHDTAASVGRSAQLVVRDGGVRVDRAQVDVLRDVLIQLVRNSVAHGIEPPEVRRQAGKPERGQVTIEAHVVGDVVRISVSDDGAGLDLEAISAQGARRGVRVETLADAGLAIFAPGLSTASTITELAGRGVGLDVAKQRIEAMHGSITVESQRGQSTTFTIELPTTVATITALVVSCDGVAYALPSSVVDRALRVELAKVRHADGRSLTLIGDTWIPLGTLSQVLGGVTPPADRGPAIVLVQGGRRIVLLVDSITGLLDLAVGALDARLGRVRHVTGQARLANGTVALVLNTSDVVEDVLGMAIARPAQAVQEVRRRRVLVVDDSATTRALEANILRTAGYEVVTAVDGEAALRQLVENLNVDLIVSDVDMPNLDGFGLTQAVRGIERLATVPIVLVTARSTDADRAKGLRVGASAFLVKSSFDQTVLLQTIARLL